MPTNSLPAPAGPFNPDQGEFAELVRVWRFARDNGSAEERSIAYRDLMAQAVRSPEALLVKLDAMSSTPGGGDVPVHGAITAAQVCAWDAERVVKAAMLRPVGPNDR